jgi:8-oxo-dGTP diphosphatase
MMDNKAKGKEFIGNGVVYFCHDGKGNFLMHKRSAQARDEHGKWDIGAGSLELGETAEATLRREIKEEYNCDVLNFELLGYRDIFREQDGKPTHWLALDFKVLVDPAQVKNGEPHKFETVAWFTNDSLPEQQHSQLPHFLKKYGSRLWS